MERTGGSRLAQRQTGPQRRLPPVAHPERWATRVRALHHRKQMKSRIEECRRAVCLACLVLGFAVAASADVIRQTVSYPTNVAAAWPSIDFEGDATPELSFEFYALGHESGGTMFLDVHSSQSTQVLLQDYRVLPLQAGDTVSLTPVMGQWQSTGIRNYVWSLGFSSLPEAPPSPGQGVGMPGHGDSMGVRFLSGNDWHYAWVRFGPLTSSTPSLGWPSVLEYAYETFPNTPIVVPEPPARALILSACLLCCFCARQKGMAWRWTE